MESVDLQGDVFLKSLLTYPINIHDEVGGPGNRSEYFFLPAGRDSAKTAARLVAESVKEYKERQPE